MELPNRATLEGKFARRLERLNADQRRKLLAILGNPPRWELIPESFWQEMERDTQNETIAALYLLFIASANYHTGQSGMTRDATLIGRMDNTAEAYAAQRSRDFAASYVGSAQRRIERLAQRMRNEAAKAGLKTLRKGEPAEVFRIDQAKLDEEVAKALGPNQAASAANNEVTAAQNAGGDAGVDATVGLSASDTWDIHPELSRGGVCVNCKRMANIPRSQWQLIPLETDDGHQFATREPGNAPGCNCTTRYANLVSVPV